MHRTPSRPFKIIKIYHVSNGNSKFAMFFWNLVGCEKTVLLDRFVLCSIAAGDISLQLAVMQFFFQLDVEVHKKTTKYQLTT